MKTLFALLLLANIAYAESFISTPGGSYIKSTSGNTTFVTQVGKTDRAETLSPLLFVPSGLGTHHIFTPDGSYMVIRSENSTTVLQTGETK